MLEDDILDGIVCSTCCADFKDTEGASIGHSEPVVCHQCWSKLPAEKKAILKKAFFYTEGYLFSIKVSYQGEMKEYIIKPLHNIDQIVYAVYDIGLLCVVGLNHRAKWDADREIRMDLVYEIGEAIDINERE